MRMIDLQHLISVLACLAEDTVINCVAVDHDVRAQALVALERMPEPQS